MSRSSDRITLKRMSVLAIFPITAQQRRYMFDSLPSVGHATAGDFSYRSIPQFALHRPRIFVAVEVAVDQLRQAEFAKSESDLRLKRFASIAASLIRVGDPYPSTTRPGLPVDLVETDPSNHAVAQV